MTIISGLSALLRSFVRTFCFYFFLLAPIVLLFVFFAKLFPFAFDKFENNGWAYLFAAISFYLFYWLSYILFHLCFPALSLIFYKVERERSPKKIIQIGDRFRKFGLPAPQVFILNESSIWKNHIFGFFSLPSPLGSILLLDKAHSKMLEDELDPFLFDRVIETKFFRSTTFIKILFLHLPTFYLTVLAFLIFINPDYANLAPLMFCVTSTLAILLALLHAKHKKNLSKSLQELYLEEKTETSRKIPSHLFRNSAISLSPLIFITAIFISYDGLKPNSEANFAINSVVENYVNVASEFQSVLSPLDNNFKKFAPVQNTKSSVNEFSSAVMSGDLRKVIRLIGKGQNLKVQDSAIYGATPLLVALRAGDLEMTYLLLNLGSSLATEVDFNGRGALFYALQSTARVRTVSYVLSGKIDPYQKDYQGKTVYEYAAENGYADALDLLNKRGLASAPSDNSSIRASANPNSQTTQQFQQ